jgi:uncharacterized protein YjbI with pentapeptide repeats
MPTPTEGVSPPDLLAADKLARFNCIAIEEGAEFSDFEFVELAWRERHVTQVHFDRAVFDKVDFAKSKFRDVSFGDVRIRFSDLSNADWTGISACRVEILSSKLTGFNGAEGKYRHALFQGCRMEYAVFQLSKFERCQFENCVLTDATFEAAALDHVAFRNCDLTNARFINARLQEVDLRGSRIEGLAVSLADLSKVTIDLLQAPAIAALTGVRIVDN